MICTVSAPLMRAALRFVRFSEKNKRQLPKQGSCRFRLSINPMGGLEDRSPPSVIRPQRHARWGRKPCAARFPYAVRRPASAASRRTAQSSAEKIAAGELFRRPGPPKADAFCFGRLSVSSGFTAFSCTAWRHTPCPALEFRRWAQSPAFQSPAGTRR